MTAYRTLMIMAALGLCPLLCGCPPEDIAAGTWEIWTNPGTVDFDLVNKAEGSSSTRLGQDHYVGQWEVHCIFRIRVNLAAEAENGVTKTIVADFSTLPGVLGLLTNLGWVEYSECVEGDCTTSKLCVTYAHRTTKR